GVEGDTQVGLAYSNSAQHYHAMLWHGTAASAVDLHPGGIFAESWAITASGGIQIGTGGLFRQPRYTHALFWHGSAASAVDLNPPGAISSGIGGISGDQITGTVNYGVADHAGLWLGATTNVIDLNPSWATDSWASGTNGSVQVGVAYNSSGRPQSVLW